jgi:hypothetical protein
VIVDSDDLSQAGRREIRRVTLTYLVTDGPAGRRISALLVHSP